MGRRLLNRCAKGAPSGPKKKVKTGEREMPRGSQEGFKRAPRVGKWDEQKPTSAPALPRDHVKVKPKRALKRAQERPREGYKSV